ncbi:MAG: hypothetical protein R3B60_01230 [Candidatus Paceibacterota bacterium]
MGQFDSKVVGAFIVGFAIVAGTYVVKGMADPVSAPKDASLAAVSEAPPRVFIDVKDSNDDGLEDWQEKFLTPEPIYLKNEIDPNYELPTTLTGQTGISLFSNLVSIKTANPFGRTPESVAEELAKDALEAGKDKMYDLRDISVSSDTSGEAVRTYANAMASAILDNDSDAEYEIESLQNIMNSAMEGSEYQTDIDNLNKLANVYQKTINDSLVVPVPKQLVKVHLDLINVYNALKQDVEGMSQIMDDPLLTLVRLKRYEDDTLGLKLALENMYEVLVPYASQFDTNDPAVLFVAINTDLNNIQ